MPILATGFIIWHLSPHRPLGQEELKTRIKQTTNTRRNGKGGESKVPDTTFPSSTHPCRVLVLSEKGVRKPPVRTPPKTPSPPSTSSNAAATAVIVPRTQTHQWGRGNAPRVAQRHRDPAPTQASSQIKGLYNAQSVDLSEVIYPPQTAGQGTVTSATRLKKYCFLLIHLLWRGFYNEFHYVHFLLRRLPAQQPKKNKCFTVRTCLYIYQLEERKYTKPLSNSQFTGLQGASAEDVVT